MSVRLSGVPLRLLLLVLVVLASGTTLSRAEPAFAVRTGYRCSQCHENRTGGGLRTAFGSIYSQTTLPRSLLRWRESGNLLPADPEARFAFGADARFRYLSLDSRHGEDISSFEEAKANVYGAVRLAPDRLTLYLDERLSPGGASARELFGLFTFGSRRGYLKVGKFLPAYGWRLPDDNAYIRQYSGFAYTSPDTGIELGLEPGRTSLHLAVLNGSGGGGDTDRSKRFTLLAVQRFERWRVGVSGANQISDGARTTHAGLLAGANAGRFALLAEGDWMETRSDGVTSHQLLALFEADVLVTRGVNVKLAHDWIDPDLDVSTDARTRDSVGVEFIPYPFLQLRWFVRRTDGPPQVSGTHDVQAEFELHAFF